MVWILPLYVSTLALSVFGVFRFRRRGATGLARASAAVGFVAGIVPLIWVGITFFDAANHGSQGQGVQNAAPWLILIALFIFVPALLVWAVAVMIAFAKGRAAALQRER